MRIQGLYPSLHEFDLLKRNPLEKIQHQAVPAPKSNLFAPLRPPRVTGSFGTPRNMVRRTLAPNRVPRGISRDFLGNPPVSREALNIAYRMVRYKVGREIQTEYLGILGTVVDTYA